MRLEGFAEAVSEAGLQLPAQRVVTVDAFGREDGYRGMQGLLALADGDRPDAVFAFNDLMAIGALRACHEAGVRVPDDVAIGGFDDIEEGRYQTPSLTTITPDLDALTATVVSDRPRVQRLLTRSVRSVMGVGESTASAVKRWSCCRLSADWQHPRC